MRCCADVRVHVVGPRVGACARACVCECVRARARTEWSRFSATRVASFHLASSFAAAPVPCIATYVLQRTTTDTGCCDAAERRTTRAGQPKPAPLLGALHRGCRTDDCHGRRPLRRQSADGIPRGMVRRCTSGDDAAEVRAGLCGVAASVALPPSARSDALNSCAANEGPIPSSCGRSSFCPSFTAEPGTFPTIEVACAPNAIATVRLARCPVSHRVVALRAIPACAWTRTSRRSAAAPLPSAWRTSREACRKAACRIALRTA